eukprot:3725_1
MTNNECQDNSIELVSDLASQTLDESNLLHHNHQNQQSTNALLLRQHPPPKTVAIISYIIILFYLTMTFIQSTHYYKSQQTEQTYLLIICLFGLLIILLNTIIIIYDRFITYSNNTNRNVLCYKACCLSCPLSCKKCNGYQYSSTHCFQIPIFLPTIIMFNILFWYWFGTEYSVDQLNENIINTKWWIDGYWEHNFTAHFAGNMIFFGLIAICFESAFNSMWLFFIVFWFSMFYVQYRFNKYYTKDTGRGASGMVCVMLGLSLVIGLTHIHWFINNFKNYKVDSLKKMIHYINAMIFIFTMFEVTNYIFFYGQKTISHAAHANGLLIGMICAMVLVPIFDIIQCCNFLFVSSRNYDIDNVRNAFK